MDEGASAVSRERVVAQFSGYLPNLGLDAALAGRAFEYFHERASMWDQPAAGLVEFRHRTFQEYLAAGWAMQQDKVGALAGHAAKPPWRETIVLAAGSGTPAQSWALLQGLLKQAAATKETRYVALPAAAGVGLPGDVQRIAGAGPVARGGAPRPSRLPAPQPRGSGDGRQRRRPRR